MFKYVYWDLSILGVTQACKPIITNQIPPILVVNKPLEIICSYHHKKGHPINPTWGWLNSGHTTSSQHGRCPFGQWQGPSKRWQRGRTLRLWRLSQHPAAASPLRDGGKLMTKTFFYGQEWHDPCTFMYQLCWCKQQGAGVLNVLPLIAVGKLLVLNSYWTDGSFLGFPGNAGL